MEFIRSKQEKPHLDIAPLVDMVFLLLIFFLLSSDFIEPMIKMELPKAFFEEKLEKVDLVVTASSNNKIYINRDEVTLKDLKVKLEEKMVSLGKYDVVFNGDRSIGYELFVEILDIAKQAGATSFSVEHEVNR